VAIHTWLHWSPHIYKLRKTTFKGWVSCVPAEQEVISPTWTDSCFIGSSSAPWWMKLNPHGCPLNATTSGCWWCHNPSVFALLRKPSVVLKQANTRRSGYSAFYLPTTSEPPTANFHTTLPDVRNHSLRQLGRYLRWQSVYPDTSHLKTSATEDI